MSNVSIPEFGLTINFLSNPIDYIQNIYIAYRQCYSTDSLTNILDKLGNISNEQKEALDEAFYDSRKSVYEMLKNKNVLPANIKTFDDYYKDNKENLSKQLTFNKIDWYQYLYMCSFIKNHMVHESPLEHSLFTFQVCNLSRAASHQLVRHRIGCSYSQQSQRYVNTDNPEVILPDSINSNPLLKDTVLQHFEKISGIAKFLRDNNVPQEDIRCVFPNACTTSLVVTMNFRSLLHFFSERCCSHAQNEIRELANTLLGVMVHHVPFVFDKAGSKCVKLGYCPETKSCGKMPTFEQIIKTEVK